MFSEELKEMMQHLPTDILIQRAELYKELASSGIKDVILRDLYNEEVERRIAKWEITEE
jgi:hypothetical protein